MKEDGAEGWRHDLEFEFCPDCKDVYWHTHEPLPPAEEASLECPKCGAHVLYTGDSSAPLVHC